MQINFNFFFLLLFAVVSACFTTYGQKFTENVKGIVVDEETKRPLEGVQISLIKADNQQSVVSNSEGFFIVHNVPVGRVSITFNQEGYQPDELTDVLVVSGKETAVEVALIKAPIGLPEVLINQKKIKGEAINRMATVSTYLLNPEETQKFAGSWDDPMRVVTSYPGVVQLNSGFNSFTVRGNAPVGMLYRLEGIPIHNPNHFAAIGSTGGFVTQFSTNLLSTSEFFTGAFPAEFGNATTAVFDFKFRTGNKNRKEHAARINVFGVDFATEGPFKKGKKATYLLNYRYSSLGLLARALRFETIVPAYQDLSFNLNLPTKKAGTFKVFGIGGLSNLLISAQEDSSKWDGNKNRVRRNLGSNAGAFGIAHYLTTSEKGYWHSVAAISHGTYFDNAAYFQDDFTYSNRELSNYADSRFTFTSDYNYRFGKKHINKTGIIFTHINHDFQSNIYTKQFDRLDTLGQSTGNTKTYQFFTQSKFDLSDKWNLTAGIHFLYLALNQKFSIEPRGGITFKPSKRSLLTLGYGLHSRVEDISVYFQTTKNEDGTINQRNKELELMKAHHGVLRFAYMLTTQLKLTAETYLQYLSNVPADPLGAYSVQNLHWKQSPIQLANVGEGRNYGVELSLRKFTTAGFYFMLTGALFQSEYKGGDGIWRNTEFNQTFSYNALIGKEFELKPKKTKERLLAFNANLRHSGGTWQNPIDETASSIYGWTRYDFNNPYSERQPDLVNFDFTLKLKGIHKKFTGEFSIQIKNLFNSRTVIGREWDERIQEVKEIKDYGVIPVIGYKIWF